MKTKEEKKLERQVIKSRKQLLKEYKKATREPLLSSDEKKVGMDYLKIILGALFIYNTYIVIFGSTTDRIATQILDVILPIALTIFYFIAIKIARML